MSVIWRFDCSNICVAGEICLMDIAIMTPLRYSQFTWSQRNQNKIHINLIDMDIQLYPFNVWSNLYSTSLSQLNASWISKLSDCFRIALNSTDIKRLLAVCPFLTFCFVMSILMTRELRRPIWKLNIKWAGYSAIFETPRRPDVCSRVGGEQEGLRGEGRNQSYHHTQF